MANEVNCRIRLISEDNNKIEQMLDLIEERLDSQTEGEKVTNFCKSFYEDVKLSESGNVLYEWTYDNNNKCLTYKDSKGLWYEYTYDENNNILTYKDSFDCYEIKGQGVTKEEFESFVIPEYTMEELVAKLGYSFKIKK